MSINWVSIGSDNGLLPIQHQAIKQMLGYFNWTLRNKLHWNFNQNIKIFIHEKAFENIVCEMAAILSRGRWVNAVCLYIIPKVKPVVLNGLSLYDYFSFRMAGIDFILLIRPQLANELVLPCLLPIITLQFQVWGANLVQGMIYRADSRFAASQWETSLQSNAISHWLGTNLQSALIYIIPKVIYFVLYGFTLYDYFSFRMAGIDLILLIRSQLANELVLPCLLPILSLHFQIWGANLVGGRFYIQWVSARKM